MTIVVIQLAVLIVVAGFNGVTVLRLNAPHARTKRMDFFDHAARDGIAASYLAVALTSFMALMNVGLEYRLPVTGITFTWAAIGLQRELRREMHRGGTDG